MIYARVWLNNHTHPAHSLLPFARYLVGSYPVHAHLVYDLLPRHRSSDPGHRELL
jgi:hypothetical protein